MSEAKITIGLKIYDDNVGLTSRSFARYIMDICEKCDEVTLDFEGIDEVWPSFCDEIFRVWQNDHPEVHIVVHNAQPDVLRRICAAQAKGGPESLPEDVMKIVDSVLGRNK